MSLLVLMPSLLQLLLKPLLLMPLMLMLPMLMLVAQLVREVLCELELPYLQKTTGRGSPKRQELIDNYGHFQVRGAAAAAAGCMNSCLRPLPPAKLHRSNTRAAMTATRVSMAMQQQLPVHPSLFCSVASILYCALSAAKYSVPSYTHTPAPVQVPFIEDPNTGIAMFESKDIVDYLRSTYGTSA